MRDLVEHAGRPLSAATVRAHVRWRGEVAGEVTVGGIEVAWTLADLDAVTVAHERPVGALAIIFGYFPETETYTPPVLRAVAVGRKNYLFAGSDAGGRSAAVLYSVVGTCRRLGLDPFSYLRDALTRFPSRPVGCVDDLLPDRWAAGRAGTRARY